LTPAAPPLALLGCPLMNANWAASNVTMFFIRMMKGERIIGSNALFEDLFLFFFSSSSSSSSI
jgi:hypothetical protein